MSGGLKVKSLVNQGYSKSEEGGKHPNEGRSHRRIHTHPSKQQHH